MVVIFRLIFIIYFQFPQIHVPIHRVRMAAIVLQYLLALSAHALQAILEASVKRMWTNAQAHHVSSADNASTKLIHLNVCVQACWEGYVSSANNVNCDSKRKKGKGRKKRRWEDNIYEWTEMDFAS